MSTTAPPKNPTHPPAKVDATDENPPAHSASRRRFLATVFASIAGAAIGNLSLRALLGDGVLSAEAAELSRETVTVDLHCHPNALRGPHFPAVDPALAGNMKAGGLDVGLFAARGDYPIIRTDASGRRYESRAPKRGELFERTQQQLDRMIEATQIGMMGLVRSPAEIAEAKQAGKPAALLAIEGSDPLEGEPSRVKFFYDRGVRVLQLMHYRINEIGDIQTAAPRHHGLTPFGRQVVHEMNRLGMVIDTAHCASDTLAGVLAESRHPVIFSHTGVYALRKLMRHLEDKDMKAIAAKGGVIGIWPHLRPRDTIDTFFRDVDYTKKLVGADHVGVASDLFGLDNHTAIPTHTEFALIAAGLLKRGYTETEVGKIIGGNFVRLFKEVSGG